MHWEKGHGGALSISKVAIAMGREGGAGLVEKGGWKNAFYLLRTRQAAKKKKNDHKSVGIEKKGLKPRY